ncbi:CRISPR-associated ring nuclease Crn3/Csx3 [Anabaena sp. UHCC 0204]|uniref:CRISPR-associated ring nuclease Crn3/Csx3 n=1 Tax=Anabaena sp. UHCC 0204 TaxID=2590009 RepID=UPI00144546E3|nr:CRISPR-associated ring nuclease Crn3/Csx3 [Anabaena sp. UHCC 0204]MTJ07799.1 CRISPR-associated protein Csx3 [Anabaena sp. UHCC 0204]
MNLSPLFLSIGETQIYENLHYQFLLIELVAKDRLITPDDLMDLSLPQGIDATGGIIISGRAPIWLFGCLVHKLHPTAWVACYDPRLGAVVVATHSKLVHSGEVIPIHPENGRKSAGETTTSQIRSLCPALMIVGPPNSGKSVLSHALFQALLADNPHIYLQRAHWDGEGNYLLELGENATDAELEEFKARDRGKLTDRFYPYHAQSILQLRRQKSLVIVDVGGMVQPEKLPILEACSHYLIISSQLESIAPWHEFCHDRGNLSPVATIISSLADVAIVHKTQPYLEMTYGTLILGKTNPLPDVLLQQVKSLISK